MLIIFIIVAVILLIITLCFYSIAPNKRKNIDFPFKNFYIAHRGLFNNNTESLENSMSSFRKAIEYGYGIELDVQLTKDGKLVVFHDTSMQRMCVVDRSIYNSTYSEIKKCKLLNSDETIPLFKEVLEEIDGKVPLIVEIKSKKNWKKTTYAVLRELRTYKGKYCIQSFNPLILRIIKKSCPDIIRGQLSTDFFKDFPNKKWYEKFFMSNLMLNFISRPDFISYNHKWKNQFFYSIFRKVFSGTNVAWTIKSQKELDEAEKVFDGIIFEGFIPDKH